MTKQLNLNVSVYTNLQLRHYHLIERLPVFTWNTRRCHQILMNYSMNILIISACLF